MEDIIVKIDKANIGMSRKEMIQVISYLGQSKLLVQSKNHLDYLIRLKGLTRLKSPSGWLHIRQQLQNNHIFLCHNIIVDTLCLRRSERICGGQTHLVLFLFFLLINFS